MSKKSKKNEENTVDQAPVVDVGDSEARGICDRLFSNPEKSSISQLQLQKEIADTINRVLREAKQREPES